MTAKFHLIWGVSALVLVVLAVAAGKASTYASTLGILIDNRGRYSMNRLQLVVWNLLVLSSFFAAFVTNFVLPSLQPE